jgi:hypothetical protein
MIGDNRFVFRSFDLIEENGRRYCGRYDQGVRAVSLFDIPPKDFDAIAAALDPVHHEVQEAGVILQVHGQFELVTAAHPEFAVIESLGLSNRLQAPGRY